MPALSIIIISIAVALFGLAPSSHAQVADPHVTFSNYDDAATGNPAFRIPEYFDMGKTAADPANPNKLNIGLSTFAVGSIPNPLAPWSIIQLPSIAYDTISFTVTAPEGFSLSSITLAESATLTSSRFGSSTFSGVGVVDGKTTSLPNNTPVVFDLAGQQKTSVTVTMSALLTTTGNQSGTLTAASATVALTPAQ